MKKLLVGVMAFILSLSVVLGAVGDEVATIDFPEGPATGVGVAFDGEFLYYTYASETTLHKIRPDGSGHEDIVVDIPESGLGALSYDATRGKIWAGTTS